MTKIFDKRIRPDAFNGHDELVMLVEFATALGDSEATLGIAAGNRSAFKTGILNAISVPIPGRT